MDTNYNKTAIKLSYIAGERDALWYMKDTYEEKYYVLHNFLEQNQFVFFFEKNEWDL